MAEVNFNLDLNNITNI